MHSNAPYATHMGYQHRYATYEEQGHDYPAYEPHGGPTPAYAPLVQHPPQTSSNSFIPTSAQPIPALSSSQKRNSGKKRRGTPTSATPVVPQPMGNTVPTPEIVPRLPQNPDPVTQ